MTERIIKWDGVEFVDVIGLRDPAKLYSARGVDDDGIEVFKELDASDVAQRAKDAQAYIDDQTRPDPVTLEEKFALLEGRVSTLEVRP